jgi:hypothetical protein
MRRIKQVPWFAGLLAATLLLSGCGAFSGADEKVLFKHREADALEIQYRFLASYIGSEKPCFLIHPESLTIAPFNSKGTKVSFVRSRCFTDVADHTGDETLCQHVHSVSTLFYSGESLNRELCKAFAATPTGYGSSGSLNVGEIVALAGHAYNDINHFFVSAGVFSTIDEAEQVRLETPCHYWNEVRFKFLRSREFFDSISELPHFGEPTDVAAMAEITWKAVVNNNDK